MAAWRITRLHRACDLVLVGHAFPERRQTLVKLCSGCVSSPLTRADDEVYRRQLVLVQPERLADDPADAVALDRAAGDAYRHGKTESRTALVVQDRNHAEEPVT